MKLISKKVYIVNTIPIATDNIHKAIEIFEDIARDDAIEVKVKFFENDVSYIDIDITDILSEFTNEELLTELGKRGVIRSIEKGLNEQRKEASDEKLY